MVPKKGGYFACDQDCPNWCALNICAHSVAVASLCGKLSKFISWLKRTKKTPNLTKFAQSTMPKGRGRKGSQCPRKRKLQISTENIVTNPILAQSHIDPPTSTNPVLITVHTAPTAPVTHKQCQYAFRIPN